MANTRSEADIISFIQLCKTTDGLRDYFAPITKALTRTAVMTRLHETLDGPNLLWSGCIGVVSSVITDQDILDEAILQTHTQDNNLLHAVFERQGMFTTSDQKTKNREYDQLKTFLTQDIADKALLQVEKQEGWTPLATAVWCGSDEELVDLLDRASPRAIDASAKLVGENVTTVLHALVRVGRSKQVVDALLSKLDKETIQFLWSRKDNEGKILASRMIEAAFKGGDETIAAIVPYLDKSFILELFKTLCEHEKVKNQSDGLMKFRETSPDFYRGLLPGLTKKTEIEVQATPETNPEAPKLKFEFISDHFSGPSAPATCTKPQPAPKTFFSTLADAALGAFPPASTPPAQHAHEKAKQIAAAPGIRRATR